MSEQEYNKLRKQLRYLTVTVVVFMLLAIASLVHTFINPKTTSFPRVQVVQGKPGKDATIDENKLNQLVIAQVAAQIAALPKPQNGANGQNGQSIVGSQGAQGNSIQGPAGPAGASITGAQGNPGTSAKEIELRYNAVKQQTEWRYVGDFTWSVLVTNCQILGTC